jgi:hypothetical protein
VGCILNYVRLIITREISCIYKVTPIQLLHCGQSGHNTTYNENLKLTSDVQLKKLLLFRGTPCVIRFVHVRQIRCEIYRLEKTIAVSVL